nr:MAG TPA: hypothetical protein [Caudoviricetes sp.]
MNVIVSAFPPLGQCRFLNCPYLIIAYVHSQPSISPK